MALEVEVDPGLCAGARRCEHLEPAAFRVDGSGVAQVVAGTDLDVGRAVAVAQQCPNGAIVVRVDGCVVAGAE